MPPPIAPAARLRAELDRLAEATAAVLFSLASEDAQRRAALRDAVVSTIRDYLIPRWGDPLAPLLVAVVGPTGSGKSTLVNSVAGRRVTTSGVLRPTTRRPLVWAHPDHAHRYRRLGSVDAEVVTDRHPLLSHLAIVDTPDIDSVVVEHRAMTTEVIRLADVVVFLTSAQRYADAVPWEVLAEVDARGAELIFVLNRLTRRASGAASDYLALLRSRGLGALRVYVVNEQRLRGEAGLLPGRSTERVAAELRRLAAQQAVLVEEIARRVTAFVVERSSAVAAAADAQWAEARALAEVVGGAYSDSFAEVVEELDRGALVRREVVDRWAERVGTGDLARLVEGPMSWMGELWGRLSSSRRSGVAWLAEEATTEIVGAVEARLERAAATVARGWRSGPAGRALLSSDLAVPAESTRELLAAEITAWHAGLTRLVTEEAPGRFRTARLASTGLNAAAVSAILVLFAATGGITGAEVGVAAGAAAAQQALLERALGRAAARSLAGRAREDLLGRLEGVFAADESRFHRLLAAVTDPPERAAEIRRAASAVEAEVEVLGAL